MIMIKNLQKQISTNIPKLAKLVKKTTSGFFQPLQDLNKVIGRWVNNKLYPTYESPPVQRLFEQLMMEYFDHQDAEYWTVFREARAALLNDTDQNLSLELAMVVRNYFKLRARELETHTDHGDGNIRIQLEAIQEVTLQVHEYFGLRHPANKQPSTATLDKYEHV